MTTDEARAAVRILMAGRADKNEAAVDALIAAVRAETLENVLRGLRSEDDSTQLRAIIAEVEAMK